MGIPRGTARLMLDEHRQRPFQGTVLQMGRSNIYLTQKELEKWARWHSVVLNPVDSVRPSHDPRLARQSCIDDSTFFGQLGFEHVESCDISDWEGADHLFDLNQPAPEHLAGRFDVIIDPGSIPQIFHLPNLLKNVFDLLPVGGRIIHAAVPSNNHVDLGFYMFSPTFFHDFYTANRFRIDCHYLCQYFPYWVRGRLHSAPWKIYRYEPGCLDHLSYGLFGGRQVAVFFVATKTEDSTGDVIPQLGQLVRCWQEYGDQGDDPAAVAGELSSRDAGTGLTRTAARLFDAQPWLSELYRPLKRARESLRRRLPSRMPPLVARY